MSFVLFLAAVQLPPHISVVLNAAVMPDRASAAATTSSSPHPTAAGNMAPLSSCQQGSLPAASLAEPVAAIIDQHGSTELSTADADIAQKHAGQRRDLQQQSGTLRAAPADVHAGDVLLSIDFGELRLSLQLSYMVVT